MKFVIIPNTTLAVSTSMIEVIALKSDGKSPATFVLQIEFTDKTKGTYEIGANEQSANLIFQTFIKNCNA